MANDVPTNQLTLGFVDASREASSMQLNTRALADYATYLAAVQALESGLTAMTTGTLRERASLLTTRLSNTIPAQPSSREIKLLLRYSDNVTQRVYTTSIPTIDVSQLVFLGKTDFVDITAPANMVSLINAFQALVASPVGNAVTVFEAERVGRNL